MDFRAIDKIRNLFGMDNIKFQNDFPNRVYEELLSELNIMSSVFYDQIVENKDALGAVATSLDFMLKRAEAKRRLIRSCFELDEMIKNINRMSFVVNEDGDFDA